MSSFSEKFILVALIVQQTVIFYLWWHCLKLQDRMNHFVELMTRFVENNNRDFNELRIRAQFEDEC